MHMYKQQDVLLHIHEFSIISNNSFAIILILCFVALLFDSRFSGKLLFVSPKESAKFLKNEVTLDEEICSIVGKYN